MTEVKNSKVAIKFNDKACKRIKKWKLTKLGRAVVKSAAIGVLVGFFGCSYLLKDNPVQPMAQVVESVKDKTVIDEIALNENVSFEEIDQIYSTIDTYEQISNSDIAKLEKFGKIALKSIVMDANDLGVESYDDVVIQPSNVGNNSINPNNEQEGMYCVVKVGDKVMNIHETDKFLQFNPAYKIAQDVYWLDALQNNLSGDKTVHDLKTDEVKELLEFINTTKETISKTDNFVVKMDGLFTDEQKVVFHK